MVPDLMFTNPSTGKRWFADVKGLGRGTSTYKASDVKAGRTAEAVARRGRAVHREYVRPAKHLDRKYGPAGLEDDETGPVEAKLAEYGRVRGFVFGAAGELSPDLMEFISELARMGAAKSWRRMGARNVLEARNLIARMALETLGIAAVRANARCKLDRAAAAFGGLEGSAARRRSDRYNYEEQQRFRRNLDGHRRTQRFNGWRAHRWSG